jgi:ankyrin repeat protein
MDVMKKFILNSSKGLAEITKSKTPTVQFIHESVRDFLVKENGLGELFPDLGSNFQGQSHDRLKQCCLIYMGIDHSAHLDMGKPLPEASEEEAADLRQLATKMFPFLEYAIRMVLCHADAAESRGVDQGDLIRSFPLDNWIKLNNLFEKAKVRRYTQNASLLYILAEHNMSNLIRIHPNNLSYVEVEDERYGLPLFAALATGSKEAVQTFIELETSKLREIYRQYRYDESKDILSGRGLKFSKRRTLLSYMAELGDEMVWAFMLDARKISVADTKDKYGQTPLFCAAQKGYTVVVKLLLETGEVYADSRDNTGQTPLSWAARNGNETIVKLLLATGKVDIDSRDYTSQTPLLQAARNGHEVVVKLLLATGKVDTDSRDIFGQTPFSRAAGSGHEVVVKLLLATGKVDTDLRDNNYGRTPLSWAAINGHEAIVKLLLATGKVDVDLRDNSGQTPLSWAAIGSRNAIVKLLLKTGEVDADSRDNEGQTPLRHAVDAHPMHEAEGVVPMLLATGNVDPSAIDNFGTSPLARIKASSFKDRDEILEQLSLYIEKYRT